jgi:small subunit ribosomal protein S4
VRAGDVITLRNRPNLKEIYRERVTNRSGEDCSWISMDNEEMKAIVTTLPTMDDVSLRVDVGQVVAFMSR